VPAAEHLLHRLTMQQQLLAVLEKVLSSRHCHPIITDRHKNSNTSSKNNQQVPRPFE